MDGTRSVTVFLLPDWSLSHSSQLNTGTVTRRLVRLPVGYQETLVPAQYAFNRTWIRAPGSPGGDRIKIKHSILPWGVRHHVAQPDIADVCFGPDYNVRTSLVLGHGSRSSMQLQLIPDRRPLQAINITSGCILQTSILQLTVYLHRTPVFLQVDDIPHTKYSNTSPACLACSSPALPASPFSIMFYFPLTLPQRSKNRKERKPRQPDKSGPCQGPLTPHWGLSIHWRFHGRRPRQPDWPLKRIIVTGANSSLF